MFVEETPVLSFGEGTATVSTVDLFRIIEFPSGNTVGELACVDEAYFHSTKRYDRPMPTSPWKVAIEYWLLNALKAQGVPLLDVVIPPFAANQCNRCGSLETSWTPKMCRWGCDSVGKPVLPNRKDRVFYQTGEQPAECQERERAWQKIMAAKSEVLRQVFDRAGIDPEPNGWWLVDGRPDDSQFVSLPAEAETIAP